MVPLDFHKYRRDIAQALRAQMVSLFAKKWDAFDAVWIAYAVSQDGFQSNLQLEELVNRLEQWAAQENSWEWHRNLGPLSLYCWLREHMGRPCDTSWISRLSEAVKHQSADHKLSLLRDAEQVFLLALGLSGGEEVKAHLIEIIKQQLGKGPLRRNILYTAALREMGENVAPVFRDPSDAGDVIALVWWAERYSIGLRKDEQWQRFGNLVNTISFDEDDASEGQRALSVSEMALLYEAITREVSQPDPTLLFEYFPLHPRLREISRDHFHNGKYVVAVEQACKVLNELIQQIAGVHDKSEAELVQATMKHVSDPNSLRVKFNTFLSETSGKNEQSGLALICEGVFKAFRNPKTHMPEDHSAVRLDPYDALAQLVTISYLMVRIERSKDGKQEA